MQMRRFSCLFMFWLLVVAGACSGDGSDIGPLIAPLEGPVLFATVQDDDGRGVANARVEIVGLGAAATTRTGRAELPVAPAGRRLVRVAPENGAAALDGLDDLVGYAVELDTSGSFGIEEVLHVADVRPSNGTSVVNGAQPGAVTLMDDTAPSGAVVTLASGTVVSGLTSSPGTLRSGRLLPEHLPGMLPGEGGTIPGRGVQLAPAGVTFSPAATLSAPADGFPANSSVVLYRLDETSGAWTQVGLGMVDGAGARIDSIGGVVGRTGLYAFGQASMAALTTVTGSVVDADGVGVSGVFVRSPQARAVTGVDGGFELSAFASLDGSGGVRSLPVEFVGGGPLRPMRQTTTITTVVGDPELELPAEIELDTVPMATFRGLLVSRGRPFVGTWFGLSASDRPSEVSGFTDGNGRIDLFEVDTTVVTFVSARINTADPLTAFSTEGATFLPRGLRSLDLRLFVAEVSAISSGTDTFAFPVDERGGGTVEGAILVRDVGAGLELLGPAPPTGAVPVPLGDDGTITAALQTTAAGGRDVISAYSIRRPGTSRVELLLQRARAEPEGFLETHISVSGEIQGAPGSSPQRRLLAAPLQLRRTWFDDVARGIPRSTGGLPRDVDPNTSAGATAFTVGVPRSFPWLAVAVGDVVSGQFRVDEAGAAVVQVADPSATSVTVDVDASIPWTNSVGVPAALTNLDGRLDQADFELDVAFSLPTNFLVDAVRDVGGNHMFGMSGDVTLVLPEAGAMQVSGLASSLVWLSGTDTVGSGERVMQGQLLEFDTAGNRVSGEVGFLSVPTITAPVQGATVGASAGVDVTWVAPDGVDAIEVELRTRDRSAPVQRRWCALVAPEITQFRFGDMPDTVPDPIEPGDYTLSVRALRVASGVLLSVERPFLWVSERRFAYRDSNLGATTQSSFEIDLTLN